VNVSALKMDFKKLASDAGTLFSRAKQVRLRTRCESAKLTTYEVRNENAKLNVCIGTIAPKTNVVYCAQENVKPISS